MSEGARVSAAQLTDRGPQADAATGTPRPRLSLNQIFTGSGKEIVEVPIDLVNRDESQAREEFDKGRLEELAASIRREGIIEPLELRPDASQDGHFVIIWGERRWRAAQLAGLATVPAVINREPKHVRRRQLYENVMREDLNAVELARVVAQTMEEDGLDSKGMAEQLRWPLRKVQRLIEIHEAPLVVKTAMVKGANVDGERRVLSSRHALDVIRAYRHYARGDKTDDKEKALAKLEKLIARVLAEEWSAKKLQAYVGALGRPDDDAAPPAADAAAVDATTGDRHPLPPVFEISDETFVIDLARARRDTLGPTERAELVAHLRRLLAEFEVAA
ncbi:ParB/RepB/Spo0J family partition protein [Anaeromyxobacter oryzisoli]|uniref:ParB/RepB/Spo0J family partition protein n=1 Tax=Anaeromyxobacter oryzisoli TaxID=2925408 RepID=UPI001F5AFC16|nr:ParB/RepB/Spo0J family partition protein [Anaeromyxobacter sp. SG63]